MRVCGLRRIVLAYAAVLILVAVNHFQPGMDASAMERPGPAAELLLRRLQQALAAVSETPLRTRMAGTTVFFESGDLSTSAGNVVFSGRLNDDSTGDAFEGVLERFSLQGGRIRLELKQAARIRSAPDGIVAIEGVELDGPHGRISAAGSLSPDGKFELVLHLSAIDLRVFIPLLAQTAVGILDGELRLRGQWENFPIGADIVLTAGRLRPEAGIPPLDSLHLEARLDRHRLDIHSFDGQLGGAPFRVTGRIEDPLDLPENGRVDLSLTGDNLLLYRTEGMRLRAAAGLRFTGPYARLDVNGTLSITDGRYEKSVGLLEGLRGAAHRVETSRLDLFSIRSLPLRDAKFDVAVIAAKPFEIKNNRVRAIAHPQLRLTGSGEKPILTGRVDFGPSTLYLPGGRMHFEAGTVRFQPLDPNRPLLEFSGRGRLQGYEVSAVFEGPYDQPTVTLSSAPALSNEELLLLVLSGQTPAPRRVLDAERSRHLDVAVLIGKEMMGRIEGPRSNGTLQSAMDRFDVDVGPSLTRSGDETVRVLFRVASDIFREGDTLSLAGEKDAYGFFNGGVRIAFRFR